MISLEQQQVKFGKWRLNLESGMAVSVKLRSRPVISLISDLFTKQLPLNSVQHPPIQGFGGFGRTQPAELFKHPLP